jgi:hypothetical protein
MVALIASTGVRLSDASCKALTAGHMQGIVERVAALEAAVRTAHTQLMNLQPHIEELDKSQQSFVDAHVDVAMAALSEALPETMNN